MMNQSLQSWLLSALSKDDVLNTPHEKSLSSRDQVIAMILHIQVLGNCKTASPRQCCAVSSCAIFGCGLDLRHEALNLKALCTLTRCLATIQELRLCCCFPLRASGDARSGAESNHSSLTSKIWPRNKIVGRPRHAITSFIGPRRHAVSTCFHAKVATSRSQMMRWILKIGKQPSLELRPHNPTDSERISPAPSIKQVLAQNLTAKASAPRRHSGQVLTQIANYNTSMLSQPRRVWLETYGLAYRTTCLGEAQRP